MEKKYKIVLSGMMVVLLVASVFHLLTRERTQEAIVPVPVAQAPVGKPTFTWSYRSSEKSGIPQTEVILSATYENGMSETHTIDQIEGSCNEYEPKDANAYERSTMIICYYAGLGRYYKVVEGTGGYTAERKVFEEASPDYDPPQQEYEVVSQFLIPA